MVKSNQLGVINNPYQGKHKRVLTVCSAGCLRSPTAAHILSSPPFNFNTRAAGVSTEYAIVPVTESLVLWAEEIVVMEPWMAEEINKIQNKLSSDTNGSMYEYEYKIVRVLEIEDEYGYRDPNLVQLMKDKFKTIYAREVYEFRCG